VEDILVGIVVGIVAESLAGVVVAVGGAQGREFRPGQGDDGQSAFGG
jgi:hypothetical protein